MASKVQSNFRYRRNLGRVDRASLPKEGHFEIDDILAVPGRLQTMGIREISKDHSSDFIAVEDAFRLAELFRWYGDQHALLGFRK